MAGRKGDSKSSDPVTAAKASDLCSWGSCLLRGSISTSPNAWWCTWHYLWKQDSSLCGDRERFDEMHKKDPRGSSADLEWELMQGHDPRKYPKINNVVPIDRTEREPQPLLGEEEPNF
jgi:hypothetical protein